MSMRLIPFIAIILALPMTASAQSVTKLSMNFYTQQDDKDGDSQVDDHIINKTGTEIANLVCCSAGKHSKEDTWNNYTGNDRVMTLTHTFDKAALHGSTVVFGLNTVGHDTWIYTPTLTATYSDGTSEVFKFDQVDSSSVGGHAPDVRQVIK